MANPTTAATTPVKNLPVVRPRAPLVLLWVLPVELAGREEVEEGVPELFGGAEEEEEENREEVELGELSGRELWPSICC